MEITVPELLKLMVAADAATAGTCARGLLKCSSIVEGWSNAAVEDDLGVALMSPGRSHLVDDRAREEDRAFAEADLRLARASLEEARAR